VWRLQSDEGNATAIKAFGDDRLIINMSIWESVQALADFVYRSGHLEVLRRRRDWFQQIKPYMALWWVPAGHIPSLTEAEERLEHLRSHGPTPFAFTFRAQHSADQAAAHTREAVVTASRR
jgi:Domain of unknown function (DUF3291)